MKIKNETEHVICFNEHEIPIGETADIDFESGNVELGLFGQSNSKIDNKLDVEKWQYAYFVGPRFSSETSIPLRTNCHLDANSSDEYIVKDKDFTMLFTVVFLNFKSIKLHGLEMVNSKTNKKVKASYNLVRKIENKWTYIFSIVEIIFNMLATLLMTFTTIFLFKDWIGWDIETKIVFFFFFVVFIFGLINNIPILRILFRKPKS